MYCCMRGTLFNAALLFAGSSVPVAFAQPPPDGVLFENVRIFDGTTAELSGPSNVLVSGNVIAVVSTGPVADPPGTAVERIQGNGRTLMPGLIDNHWHTMLARPTPAQSIEDDPGYSNLL